MAINDLILSAIFQCGFSYQRLTMSRMVGGFGETQPATPEVQDICDKIKPTVEERAGENYAIFKVTEFRKQLVNGVNYEMKVSTGGDNCVFLKVYQTFGGELSLSAYRTNRKLNDPFVF
ncbi:cystatin-B-like [Pelobates fuscus]|uniref:cystatin-B-like n=1 Tax=Pelobates fuscus TaxID=191477 RepID=UPI002FE4ECFE